MVNSKGAAEVKQELCRYCRKQVCEECYEAAAILQAEPVMATPHRHVCLACSRLHSRETVVHSPERRRRQGLPRLNSAPPTSHAPRIDSLSNMSREHERSRRMQHFLAARKREQKPIATTRRTSRRERSSRTVQTDEPTPELELSTVDLRRRRHTTAIAPTSRSCDLSSRSKGLTARDLLRATATELRPSRANLTSYSCDFTGSTAKMAIRSATATDTNDLELSTVDRSAPTSYSCDFSGRPQSCDDANDLDLSTVDLRLPKYQAKLPKPAKKAGRKERSKSALTPISLENLAAIDAKLSSVEHTLQRYSTASNVKAAKVESTTKTDDGASMSKSVDFTESKVVAITREEMLTSNRSRVVDKKIVKPWKYKHPGSPTADKEKSVDFHLSSLGLRSRRHTTAEATKRKKSPPSSPEKEDTGLMSLRQKSKAEPIDFHLSTFDLKPRSPSKATAKSNQVEVDYNQKKAATPTPKVGTPTYSKYVKDDPCDLSYLDNFRSYTV